MTTPAKWCGELPINATVFSFQARSSLLGLSDKRFVAAWELHHRDRDAVPCSRRRTGWSIRSGHKRGGDCRHHHARGWKPGIPAAAALEGGRLVESSTNSGEESGDGSGSSIKARIFDPRLAPVRSNGTSANDQFQGSLFADVVFTLTGGEVLTILGIPLSKLGDDILIA